MRQHLASTKNIKFAQTSAHVNANIIQSKYFSFDYQPPVSFAGNRGKYFINAKTKLQTKQPVRECRIASLGGLIEKIHGEGVTESEGTKNWRENGRLVHEFSAISSYFLPLLSGLSKQLAKTRPIASRLIERNCAIPAIFFLLFFYLLPRFNPRGTILRASYIRFN